ncbi:MAG: alpha/beta hydrolase [Pseudomonadales bacterium]|nr:alpha/beta hydrolase [Pseudomonadales bacterium]
MTLAACGRQDTTTTKATDSTTSIAPADGSPRIANSTDGVHIQYRVYGHGEPTLVFVHGWSCDSSYWNAQVEAFRKNYTVVTVDLAGHGASGRNRTNWTMANYGADVAAAVKDLPSKQLILVGHSMGGPVVIEAARLLQGRTLAAIGVDTYKTIGAPPPPPEQVEAFIREMQQDYVGTVRSFVTNTFFTRNADPLLVKKIGQDMSAAPPDVAIASLRALAGWDDRSAAKGLTIPIIAINSDLGALTDDVRIKQVWPTFRSIIVPGTGHFIMMEDPPRFDSILTEAIKTLSLPAVS